MILSDALHEHARRRPSRPALSASGIRLTYGECWEAIECRATGAAQCPRPT